MAKTATPQALIYLEDLVPGQKFVSRGHMVTADDIKAFASLYDPQVFHLDEEGAKATFFGGLAASGWHTAAISMRLLVDSMPFAGGVIGAGGQLTWPKPTRPGDTLHIETEVLEVTPSKSRPDRGTALVRNTTRNQNGESVQVFTVTVLAFKKPVAG